MDSLHWVEVLAEVGVDPTVTSDLFQKLQDLSSQLRSHCHEVTVSNVDLKQTIRETETSIEMCKNRRIELHEQLESVEVERREISTSLTEIQNELAHIHSTIHDRTSKESELREDVYQLDRHNEELVGAVMSKYLESIGELEGELAAATATHATLQQQKADSRKRIEKLGNTIRKADTTISTLRLEEEKAAAAPRRIMKQVDNMKRALMVLQDEAERLQQTLVSRSPDFEANSERLNTILESRNQVESQLSRLRVTNESREQQCSQLTEQLRLQRLEVRQLQERQLELEQAQDAARTEARQALALLERARMQLSRLTRALKFRETQLNEDSAELLPLQETLQEQQSAIQEGRAELQRLTAASERHSADAAAYSERLLRESELEESARALLSSSSARSHALATELQRWRAESALAQKQLQQQQLQLAVKRRELESTLTARRRALEASKTRELELVDLAEAVGRVSLRLKAAAAALDAAKRARNAAAAGVQAHTQAATEAKERLKILRAEVAILQTEASAKLRALSKEAAGYTASVNQRDILRSGLAAAAAGLREHQMVVEADISKLDRLSTEIGALESEMRGLRESMRIEMEGRARARAELARLRDESTVLRARADAHATVADDAAAQSLQLQEEIRALRLASMELQRQLHARREGVGARGVQLQRMRGEILTVLEDLERARSESYVLGQQLTSTSSGNAARAVPSLATKDQRAGAKDAEITLGNTLPRSSEPDEGVTPQEDFIPGLPVEGQSMAIKPITLQASAATASGRWKPLGGEDPSMEELEERLKRLEKAFATGKMTLIQKDLLLEQIEEERLAVEAAIASENRAGLEATNTSFSETSNAEMVGSTVKQMNEMQQKVRDTTRKLVALVSELSVYQGTTLKLAGELNHLEDQLKTNE